MKARSRPTRLWSAAAAVWAALILVFSVLPAEWLLGAAPRETWSALASAAHVLEFAVLAALLDLRQAWRPAMRGGGRRVLGVLGFAGLLAVAVEFVQWPLPYRSFDWTDLVADAVGIGFGLAVSRLVLRGAVRRSGR